MCDLIASLFEKRHPPWATLRPNYCATDVLFEIALQVRDKMAPLVSISANHPYEVGHKGITNAPELPGNQPVRLCFIPNHADVDFEVCDLADQAGKRLAALPSRYLLDERHPKRRRLAKRCLRGRDRDKDKHQM